MKPLVKLVAIDDDPLSLELVNESLSDEGLEIHSSTDPELGFDIILRERPQIVLLDLMMPNVTGMELLERIVQMDPSMDVVLMTAHYSTESAVEAIKKGASDYVNKPIDIPSFRQRIQKLVAGSRRRQRARELDSELLECGKSSHLYKEWRRTSATVWSLAPREPERNWWRKHCIG
jgi:two-component system, NtrC family, response regulator HydG